MDRNTPSRRQFLTASASALSLALAGCSGGETSEGSDTTTGDGGGDTETTSDDASETTTSTAQSSGSSSFAVKVVYDGEWQGSISAGGSAKSIQGSGTKTVDISGEPNIVSANAQKKDGGGDAKLTIQILKDGEVVKKSSTTAEYGMAQTTYSPFGSATTSGSSSGGSKLSVKVVYEGKWQGSISAGGSARSVQGSGTKTLDVKGSPSILSANAQKKDGGAGKKLTIKILQDGEVLKKSSTTAEYGMAQVTATL
ncbi:hypothetical protein [Halorussus sp. MSC15.2]|uniref:hypothetical protein n=1 Tax=Halorussus sp. MSC15.2 TaxID=2283638 RepID=UPI0013D3B47D|nr:hypothetical protein [Halorussus sp. MSC15.2]NEU55497.1 hypothetical protein [Halorussus sp. MSC15.2]